MADFTYKDGRTIPIVPRKRVKREATITELRHRISELEEALRDMEEPLGQIIANADDDKRWDEALKNNLDGAGEAAQEALARVRAVLERE